MAASNRACFGSFASMTFPFCGVCVDKIDCREAPKDPRELDRFDLALDLVSYAAGVPFVPGVSFGQEIVPMSWAGLLPAASASSSGPIIVSRKDLEDSEQYQRRAGRAYITWPEVFYMEGGADRRHLPLEDRNKRHQIDWFRPGSYVEKMPNWDEWSRGGNPYDGGGIGGLVAVNTWVCFKAHFSGSEGGSMKEIIDDVVQRLTMSAISGRGAIKDTMRDLALFGIVKKVCQNYVMKR